MGWFKKRNYASETDPDKNKSHTEYDPRTGTVKDSLYFKAGSLPFSSLEEFMVFQKSEERAQKLDAEFRDMMNKIKRNVFDYPLKQNTMTRQDYITAIRNGEYCIENDDLNSLIKVLKDIFPGAICPHGGGSFYYTNQHSDHWLASAFPECTKQIKASTLANMKDENKIINSEQAQRIIDSACDRWSKRLAKKWSENIVLKQNIHISQSFYQEMRSACTLEQHKLFDEIFGTDVLEFKKGDFITDDEHMPGKVFEIMDSNSSNPKLRILNPDPGDTDEYRMYGSESVRHATPEEIRTVQYPPNGTPCWVWSPSLGEWVLRYANGTGSFYMNQQKSGSLMEWKEFKLFDPNNLPFNK